MYQSLTHAPTCSGTHQFVAFVCIVVIVIQTEIAYYRLQATLALSLVCLVDSPGFIDSLFGLLHLLHVIPPKYFSTEGARAKTSYMTASEQDLWALLVLLELCL